MQPRHCAFRASCPKSTRPRPVFRRLHIHVQAAESARSIAPPLRALRPLPPQCNGDPTAARSCAQKRKSEKLEEKGEIERRKEKAKGKGERKRRKEKAREEQRYSEGLAWARRMRVASGPLHVAAAADDQARKGRRGTAP